MRAVRIVEPGVLGNIGVRGDTDAASVRAAVTLPRVPRRDHRVTDAAGGLGDVGRRSYQAVVAFGSKPVKAMPSPVPSSLISYRFPCVGRALASHRDVGHGVDIDAADADQLRPGQARGSAGQPHVPGEHLDGGLAPGAGAGYTAL